MEYAVIEFAHTCVKRLCSSAQCICADAEFQRAVLCFTDTCGVIRKTRVELIVTVKLFFQCADACRTGFRFFKRGGYLCLNFCGVHCFFYLIFNRFFGGGVYLRLRFVGGKIFFNVCGYCRLNFFAVQLCLNAAFKRVLLFLGYVARFNGFVVVRNGHLEILLYCGCFYACVIALRVFFGRALFVFGNNCGFNGVFLLVYFLRNFCKSHGVCLCRNIFGVELLDYTVKNLGIIVNGQRGNVKPRFCEFGLRRRKQGLENFLCARIQFRAVRIEFRQTVCKVFRAVCKVSRTVAQVVCACTELFGTRSKFVNARNKFARFVKQRAKTVIKCGGTVCQLRHCVRKASESRCQVVCGVKSVRVYLVEYFVGRYRDRVHHFKVLDVCRDFNIRGDLKITL